MSQALALEGVQRSGVVPEHLVRDALARGTRAPERQERGKLRSRVRMPIVRAHDQTGLAREPKETGHGVGLTASVRAAPVQAFLARLTDLCSPWLSLRPNAWSAARSAAITWASASIVSVFATVAMSCIFLRMDPDMAMFP